MNLPINKIMNGDVLTHLKELPSESIDMCMTSPPYWSLRAYQTESQIWSAIDGCEHNWIIERTPRPNGGGTSSEKSFTRRKGVDNFQRYVDNNDRASYSNFCQKCNAWKGELGLEPTFELYIKHLCNIFDEIKRVLKKEGTCWVNIGDTYGTKSGSGFENDLISKDNSGKNIKKANELRGSSPEMHKNLCNIPARFSIEMQNRGWCLRNEIIWHKPNCMPSSIKDRFTVDFEKIFFFVKSKRYYFEQQIEETKTKIKEPRMFKEFRQVYHGKNKNVGVRRSITRNKRAVWTICPKPFYGAHFAVFPEDLVDIPIKAGCPKGGVVLDPFFGSGTTGLVALKLNRKFIGIELNKSYCDIAMERLLPYLEQSKINKFETDKSWTNQNK